MTGKPKSDRDVTVPAPNSDRFTERVRLVVGDESVRGFAKRAGIGLGTLQHILEGGRPTVDKLVAVARAGGVSVEWLATGEGPRVPGAAEDQAPYTPGEPLDEDLMMECMIGADTLAPADMDPAEKARRALAVYREAKAKGLKISNIIEIMKAS